MIYTYHFTISFEWGGWHISFMKEMVLPFSPFFGLRILDGTEVVIELTNSNYCSTLIDFARPENKFMIDIRNFYKPSPMSMDELNRILRIYPEADWQRIDATKLEDFKRIIRSYEMK